MQAEIRTLSDQKVYYARGTGIDGNDFTRAAQAAFAIMNRWITDHHLHDKIVVCLGITPDDSSITPADQARYDAGFIFNPDPGLAAEGDVQIQTLPAGRWAVFVHTGPYNTLWQSWNAIYRQWLPGSGHELRDTPPYEVYVDDPGQVAAETLRTEIFIPIK